MSIAGKLSLRAMASLVTLTLIGAAGCAQPKITTSQNQRVDEITQSLEEHVRVVEYRDGQVHFVTDGQYGMPLPPDNRWAKQFSVPIGGHFHRLPDRHSTLVLKIVSIEGEHLELRYTHRFDHRAFGEARKSIDVGRVRLKWKPR